MKMKNVLMLGAALAVVGFASDVHTSQAATGTLSAEAGVVEAVTIMCGTTLNFGRVLGGVGGTVVMGTNNARTSSAGLGFDGGRETAGSCTIMGTSGYNIDVTADDATISNGSDSMDIDSFVFNAGDGDSENVITVQTVAGPPDEIRIAIGATLNVDASAGAGLYTGTITVNADYQ